jgi:lambda family phage portal protein
MKLGPFEIRFGKSAAPAKPRSSRRAYHDAAVSGDYMGNHWNKADGRDANGPIVEDLAVTRNRCRYELANNALAISAATALADAVIGAGPRLQMLTDDPAANESIEKRWTEWADQFCDYRGIQSFGQLLRMVGSMNQIDSGEAFIVIKSVSPAKYPVTLRLLVVESDRVADPFGAWSGKTVDGIEVDDEGAPLNYYLLRHHPGNYFTIPNLFEYDTIPATSMIHLFRPLRPGQNRGFPWLAPVLKPFAELRSFASATLRAADVASRLAGVLETDSSLLPGTNTDDYEAFDPVEIEAGTMLTLPKGLKLSQFKAEQPTGTYREFYETKLKEIGRAFQMPFNVLAGDSSAYNYASGRLDYQNWAKYIGVLQTWIEGVVCNRIFRRWLAEAVLIPGYLDLGGLGVDDILESAAAWFWPGQEHVDPSKEADAQTVRMNNLTTTLSDEWAKSGEDWEKKLRQIKREKELLKELGLEIKQAVPVGIPNNENQDKENPSSDETDESSGGGSAKPAGRIRIA